MKRMSRRSVIEATAMNEICFSFLLVKFHPFLWHIRFCDTSSSHPIYRHFPYIVFELVLEDKVFCKHFLFVISLLLDKIFHQFKEQK